MDAEEQYERDYEMGRRAGFYDALDFIHTEIMSKLSKDERFLMFDNVWRPLYEESRRRREQS